MMTNLMKIINGHKIDKDIDLNGAYLYEANLENANLENYSLISANLEKSNLTGANLTGANLRFADLYGANLTGANLTGANLDGANFENAILDGVNLKGTIMEKKEEPELSTLFNKLEEWVSAENVMRHKYDIMNDIVSIVGEWISQYSCETNKWDEDYKCGYMDAMDTLKKGLG